MVSPQRRATPIRRGSPNRRIIRRRRTWPGNRIRILTPDEINHRFLDNRQFAQIEATPEQSVTSTPVESESESSSSQAIPLQRSPPPFHGAGSPTHDIIEFPLPETQPGPEYPVPSPSYFPSDDFPSILPFNIPDSTNPDEEDTIPYIDIDNYEDVDINDLLTLTEFDNNFDPLFTDPGNHRDPNFDETGERAFSSLLREISRTERRQPSNTSLPDLSNRTEIDGDDQETIPALTDVADLVNEGDLGDLYEPVQLFSDDSTNNAEDPDLPRLIEEILNNEDEEH